MSQSALAAAALFAMFIVFVAARGRVGTYTDVLWGGGGKGGGTLPAGGGGGSKSDTADTSVHDTAHILQAVLPYPLSIPFDLLDTTTQTHKA